MPVMLVVAMVVHDGASKDYDALRWSDYIEQVEREGRVAAVQTGGTTRQRE